MSSKILVFFDDQYFWKEIVIVLDFVHGESNQGKIACKTTTADWFGKAFSDMP